MKYVELIIKIDEEIYKEALKSGYSHLYDEEVANAVSEGTLISNNLRDVVEPSKIKRMQELLDENYSKGFADGKEEALREFKSKERGNSMNPKELSNDELATIVRSMLVTGISPSAYEKSCLEEAANRIELLEFVSCKIETMIQMIRKE